MSKGKTREFKDRQCRYCELADPYKFKQGQPCCPLPNPRIRSGHCLNRKPTTKPISWYETVGFAGPQPGSWRQYLEKDKQIRAEVGIGPPCPDCRVESKRFITTQAQLYGVPWEDYPAYPGAFQPFWDGEWICPRCHKLVAVTNLRTGELMEVR